MLLSEILLLRTYNEKLNKTIIIDISIIRVLKDLKLILLNIRRIIVNIPRDSKTSLLDPLEYASKKGSKKRKAQINNVFFLFILFAKKNIKGTKNRTLNDDKKANKSEKFSGFAALYLFIRIEFVNFTSLL